MFLGGFFLHQLLTPSLILSFSLSPHPQVFPVQVFSKSFIHLEISSGIFASAASPSIPGVTLATSCSLRGGADTWRGRAEGVGTFAEAETSGSPA